jgi:hypothetical protein
MTPSEKYAFGIGFETLLKPRLEQLHNITLIKTEKRFDTIDFYNSTLNIELKSRVGVSTQYKTWLIPVCKVARAEKDKPKDTFFYYYWTGDKTLWRLKYDKTLFDTFHKEYPFYNPRQEHYFIPAEQFVYIPELNTQLN